MLLVPITMQRVCKDTLDFETDIGITYLAGPAL